jgi:putative ABC transport system substrate-binding protein
MKSLASWLAAIVVGFLLVVTACQRSATPQSYPDPKHVPDHPIVLVLSPEAEATRSAIDALRSELKRDFDVYVRTVEPNETKVNDLEGLMTTIRPRVVVLIDNPTVGLYRNWVQGAQKPLPAAVILMASFAAELQKAVPNSVAIPHEVPWVNAFATARAVFEQPLDKVGVVHRKRFSDYVRREAELVKVEGFELIAEVVPDEPTADELTRALDKLQSDGAQALWVLNDNALLSPDLTRECWLPFSRRFGAPILVGVPSLVSAPGSFGTFAVIPDPESLGVQAADLIYELRSQDYVVGVGVQFPLSAQVFVNHERGKRVGLGESHLDRVDVLVE